MSPADGGPVRADAVRWLASVPVTLSFCALLVVVYAAELLVWATLGFDAVTALFVADPAPSPGWILAPLAHSPVDPLHLPVNLSLLVAFGGMTERRLSRRRYYWFLLVAGLASTAGQVAGYAIASAAGDSGGTLGASGIALAATGFAVVASGRQRRVTGQWAGETTWLWTAVGAAVLGRRLVLDLVVAVPDVGRYGHLWGVLFGVTYALVGWTTE